jgi:hypothetical protein
MPAALERLLTTDRGDLWLCERENGRRALVRLIDTRSIDLSFRDAVDLVARATRLGPPRVLPIVDHDWQGAYYSIEYQLTDDTPGQPQSRIVETLPANFARHHWLRRLELVADLIRLSSAWRPLGISPIGLHAGRVVACRMAGRWLAHLAPCPPLPARSPYDLRTAHRDVLVAVAPERLRGTEKRFRGVWEDAYAAGALVMQAISAGGMPGPPPDEDLATQLLERQARGLLVKTDFTDLAIEPALRRVPRVAMDLERLQKAVAVCTAFVPGARPQTLDDLYDACRALLAYGDPLEVSLELETDGRAADALQVLDWARSVLTPNAMVRREAARLCRDLSLPFQELAHLDGVLELERHDLASRHRRMELACDQYLASTFGPGPDPQGDDLLEQLRFFLQSTHHPLGEDTAVEDWLRSAHIHARRREFADHAGDLGQAARLRQTDLDVLCRYGMSLQYLMGRNGPDTDRQLVLKLNALSQIASHVIKQKRHADLLDDDDETTWTELFQSLLPR